MEPSPAEWTPRRRQAGSAPAASHRFSFQSRCGARLGRHRDRDDRATLRMVRGPDASALGGDQTLRNRQTQARAKALELSLGAPERSFEDPLLIVSGNAGTMIAHRDAQF